MATRESLRRLVTRGTPYLRSIQLYAPRLLLAGALFSTAASSLSVYPHQLAYFNELAGGPQNGHRHMLGSNLDWTQDLLYVKQWVNSLADEETTFFYGGAALTYDPKHIGLNVAAFPVNQSPTGSAEDRGPYIIPLAQLCDPAGRFDDVPSSVEGVGVGLGVS